MLPLASLAVRAVMATALVTGVAVPAAGDSGPSTGDPGPPTEPVAMALHGDHGPPARAGEFLVRLAPDEVDALAGFEPRDLGFGWYAIRPTGEDPAAAPAEVAVRLGQRLGRQVVPSLVWERLAADQEPGFPDQWPLANPGGLGGLPGADISVRGAWGVTEGSPDVVVGVIDTGADLDHPDLVDRLVTGWDFAANDPTPEDRDGHGTAVSGIIGASANGVGLVGVSPASRIMPLKVCDFTEVAGCTDATVIEALEFAADQGVRIVNISLGRASGGNADAALRDAIAQAGSRGVLVVAAAGNSGTDNDQSPVVPASFDLPNVLAVAAGDRRHDLAGFSNFGTQSVDLAAPGDRIPALWRGNGYSTLTVTGTSFAAPHATGVAALMAAVNPCLTPTETIQVITDTVDPMAALTGWVGSGGVLDATRAVDAARRLFTDPAATPPFGPPGLSPTLSGRSSCSSGVSFEWTLSDGRTATGRSASMSYPSAGVYRERLVVRRGSLAQEATVDVPVGPQFSDDNGSVFEADIAWLAAGGITQGCAPGRYCPNDSVTRGQMASFLARFLGLPPASRDFFTDDAGSVHEGNINRIAEAGITLGCAPGLYCPNDRVSREQMASLMTRGLQLPGSPLDVFTDDAGVHEQNINALALTGITRGCRPANFCPSEQVTRGQMAAFLSRARDLLP